MNILYHIRNWLGNLFYSHTKPHHLQDDLPGIILRHGVPVGVYEGGKIRPITADEYMDLYRKPPPGGGEGEPFYHHDRPSHETVIWPRWPQNTQKAIGKWVRKVTGGGGGS